MKPCPSASLRASSILTTRDWPRIARRFRPELKELFVQVLLLAQETGVLKLGTISLDGTKMHADASRHKAVSYQRLREVETQLRAEIEELLRLSEQSDQPEVRDGLVVRQEGDGTARGPSGAAGASQSGAANTCRRACSSRAGGV